MGSRDSLSSRTNLEIYLVDGGVGTAKIKKAKICTTIEGCSQGGFQTRTQNKTLLDDTELFVKAAIMR